MASTPDVRIGMLDGNPVSEDMLEGARFLKVDFLINTVLNRRGQIARIFAGDMEAAHAAACRFAYGLYAVTIPQQADLVIAATGPTRNFVQSHKALYNAYQAMRPGGRIVLLAPCEEGLGGEQFAQWIRLGDRNAILAALRKQCEINGQTALSTLEKAPSTVMVTEMSPEEVAMMGSRKAAGLPEALSIVRNELPPDPSFYIMPSAAYTVPFFTEFP